MIPQAKTNDYHILGLIAVIIIILAVVAYFVKELID